MLIEDGAGNSAMELGKPSVSLKSGIHGRNNQVSGHKQHFSTSKNSSRQHHNSSSEDRSPATRNKNSHVEVANKLDLT